jgi:hypothetical protein
MRRTAVLVLIALGLAAEPAAARSHTINVAGDHVSGIGDFRPGSDPHVGAAVRAFGRPSVRRETSDSSCVVRWKRLGLEINFVNLGAPGFPTCRSDIGKAQSFKVRGKRVRTWKGLRVGMRERAVQRRHPSAEFRAGAWWLKTAVSRIGDPTEFAVVDARIGPRGRVRVIRGWIGAAGD